MSILSNPELADRMLAVLSAARGWFRIAGASLHTSTRSRSRLGWIVALVLCLPALQVVASCPYPPEGLKIQHVQPDGTTLKLRVLGDEAYARTTTDDGYTVIFNEPDQTYYYATKGADGDSLVSTGVPAHRAPKLGLPKQLKHSNATISAMRRESVDERAADRAAKWGARVKAVRLQRERATGEALSVWEASALTAGASGMVGAPTLLAATTAASAVSAALVQAAAAPITGSKIGLVILVQFPDDPETETADPIGFPVTQAKMARFFNETGYIDNQNTGSVRDYFYDQSNGRLIHTQLVTAVVTLSLPRASYNFSDYPTNLELNPSYAAVGRSLITAAIAKLKADGFDFSTLTVDANNRVLATSLLFAGNNSGVWSKGLWPHASALSSQINVGTAESPRYIYAYQCTDIPNAAPVIGTICHELGHLLLGLPDLYDTDKSDGPDGDPKTLDGASSGLDMHCLMGSGNYANDGKTPTPINLYLKDYTGWANIEEVAPTIPFDAILSSTGNRGYRIRKPGTTTEYFLFENRGDGDKWAQHSPSKGIAIWHIDEAVTTGNQRQQHTAEQHYAVSLIQADGRLDLERNAFADNRDFFGTERRFFNSGTAPASTWWSGEASGVSIDVSTVPGAAMSVRFGAPTSSAELRFGRLTEDVEALGVADRDIPVVSDTFWTWTKDVSWIFSSEPANQAGFQAFTYDVEANPTRDARTGVITLTAGPLVATHTVTQAGQVIDLHGNSIGTAAVVGLYSTTSGRIDTVGDVDYFRINVVAHGLLRVETTGSTDVVGALLNSAGTELREDDDSGGDKNFRITYIVTPGTYYVRVTHFTQVLDDLDSVETGPYELVSSFSIAPTLSVGPTSTNIVSDGANNSFAVTSNSTWSWTRNATWVTTNEAVDQSGDQTFTYSVAPNFTSSARSASIVLTTGELTATHSITQSGAPPDEHGNTTGTATLVAQNSITNGRIGIPGDQDVFRINVTGNGTLTLNTTGITDTLGYLMDAAGTEVATDDDAGPESNFLLSHVVSAGIYYVRVSHYRPGNVGSYQLVCAFTVAPVLITNPTALNIGTAGGTFNFTVSSNAAWSHIDNASWLSTIEPSSQNGTQTFTGTASANSGSGRTGVITFTSGALTATYTVSQLGVTSPDLVNPGTSSSVLPTTIVPGGALTVTGDVRNQGTANAGPFVVRFYLSTDSTITAADYFLGEKLMGPVATGASAVIDWSALTVPPAIPAGTYFAGWIYDATNAVIESNEANNTGHVASTPVVVSGTQVAIITKALGNGSQSRWGDLYSSGPSFLAEAELTTANGISTDAFDNVGVLVLNPAIALPPLRAPTSAGPLTASASSGAITAARKVTFLNGRHATDDEITLTNTTGVNQVVSFRIDDDYGSDLATRVHATSSGDAVVTAADGWFVSNDVATHDAISVDPTIMVSWRYTGLPIPSFPNVPASAVAVFSINFGLITIPPGETVGVTIRRELFDSAALATLNGRPVSGTGILAQDIDFNFEPDSQSRWGDIHEGNLNSMADAEYTSENGVSGDAFDTVGLLTLTPAIPLPPLRAPNGSGPLVTSATTSGITATRRVTLLQSRHATDEVISLTNTLGSMQTVSLRIDDNYGSDGATRVHRTSSGDAIVTTGDSWFITNDVAAPGQISGDPTVLVSWRFSSNLPTPTFPLVPATGADHFRMDFGTFAILPGQTVTVTIRRELFDSANIALSYGRALTEFGFITQTLPDGSQSKWGDQSDSLTFIIADGTLSTVNGFSDNAFEYAGFLTISPAFSRPTLKAATAGGPLKGTNSSAGITITNRVTLLSGKHATDQEITVTNTLGTAQSVSLRVDDGYGSGANTKVHLTSSGDIILTAADNWFISNDVSTAAGVSGDPTLQVSWQYSNNLTLVGLPFNLSGASLSSFALDFGTLTLAAGETATLTIRRAFFDRANQALADGQPLTPLPRPEIEMEHTVGVPLLNGRSAIGFDEQVVGVASAGKTVTIRNTGNASLNITGISTAGTDLGDFVVIAPSIPFTIPALSQRTFSVLFHPTAPGPRTTALQIFNNDGDEETFTITLFGVGLTSQERWRQIYFGSQGNSGDGADHVDFDSDGLVNLVEFAFGLDPTLNSAAQLPYAQRVGADFVLSFTQPNGVANVTYGAEWSTTLQSTDWHAITDTGTGNVHIFSVPSGTHSKLFMRTKVTSP